MVIDCIACGRTLNVPDRAIGRNVQCPRCRASFRAELPQAIVLDDDPAESRPDAPAPNDNPPGWYILTPAGEVGPIHLVQLARAAGAGRIGPGALVRHSDHTSARPACEIPGLFPETTPAANPHEPAEQPPATAAESSPPEAAVTLQFQVQADPADALADLARLAS
jgi:hypothetical protein